MSNSKSTGIEKSLSTSTTRKLPKIEEPESISEEPPKDDSEPENELVFDDPKKYAQYELENMNQSLLKAESIIMPVVFTLLSLFTRMYKIGINNHVVWDEAHFGKFGSYYLRHEFYHDVHPPLGKMLVGLSGYLAGYNGSWDFPSGNEYPEYIDFVKMRLFQAVFSSLCVPFAYFTCKSIGFSVYSTWLFTLMVLLDNSYVTLGRFILLDSMLLLFTVTTFFCLVRFHNEHKKPFQRKWWKWILLLGISIGCVCSVKMVGLFVTVLVGIYTIVELWNQFGDKTLTNSVYVLHWLTRILALIVIPMLVFLLSFKVHFELLWHSGPGDANMNSLLRIPVGSSTMLPALTAFLTLVYKFSKYALRSFSRVS